MKRRLDPTKLLNKAKKALNPKVPNHPDFRVGDTIRVFVKVAEGEKVRVQAYEGLVIARKNGESGGKFIVRKISYGVGVERIFPVNSPVIDRIQVVSRGDIKRAKLYYLRKLSGRSARIKSDLVFGADTVSGESSSESGDAEPSVSAQAAQA